MQSDRIDKSAFVDKVHEMFVTTFGEDMCLNKRAEAFDHMGWFELRYNYIPLDYNIVFENDRGLFSIYIYDEEGAMNNLYGIVKHENITRRMENIENALILLKKELEKNDFFFYIARGKKYYKKKNNQYTRVKNWDEDQYCS